MRKLVLYLAIALVAGVFVYGSPDGTRLAGQIRAKLESASASTGSSLLQSWNAHKAQESGASVRVRAGFSPGAASDIVLDTIASARKTIRVAAYSFTDKRVASALVKASRSKVDVRVVMDKSQRSERYSSATFLANQGIAVRIDSHYAIMHNKFMVVDGQTVQTGSYNYTKSARVRNAENVVVIGNAGAVAQAYQAEWERLWRESEPYQARNR